MILKAPFPLEEEIAVTVPVRTGDLETGDRVSFSVAVAGLWLPQVFLLESSENVAPEAAQS